MYFLRGRRALREAARPQPESASSLVGADPSSAGCSAPGRLSARASRLRPGRRCGGGERDAPLLGRRRREKPRRRRFARGAALRHARPRTGNIQSRVSVRIERDGTRKKSARNGKRGGFHVLMVMVPTLIPSSMPSSAGSQRLVHEAPRHERGRLSRLTMSGAYSGERRRPCPRGCRSCTRRCAGHAVREAGPRAAATVRRRRMPTRSCTPTEQALLGRHAVQIRLVRAAARAALTATVACSRSPTTRTLARTAPRWSPSAKLGRVGNVRVSNAPRLVARFECARACVRARARSPRPDPRRERRKKHSTSVRQFSIGFRATLRD